MVESNGLSGHLHCIVSLTEGCWRQMAEPRLPSYPVVESSVKNSEGIQVVWFFAALK